MNIYISRTLWQTFPNQLSSSGNWIKQSVFLSRIVKWDVAVREKMWKVNYKAVRSFINVITVSSLTFCVKYDRPTHKKVKQPSLITPYLAVPDAEGFIKVNAFALINYHGTPCRTLSNAVQIWGCRVRKCISRPLNSINFVCFYVRYWRRL